MTTESQKDGYNATIEDYFIGKEAHGIFTVYIRIVHDKGSHQSFGGLCLDSDEHAKDFVQSVCAIFGTTDVESLRGRRCRALYNFSGYNEPIAALETDVGRFTLHSWRKKHFPDETKSPLDSKRDMIEMNIASHERALRGLRAELVRIEADYTDLD